MADWIAELHFVIAASEATVANRNALADILANNESFATRAQELPMFDNPYRFSASGALPAQAYGIAVPVKAAMRDAFETFLEGITNARFFVMSNTTHLLILTNSGVVAANNQAWSRAKTLQALNAEFGLNLIPPAQEGI